MTGQTISDCNITEDLESVATATRAGPRTAFSMLLNSLFGPQPRVLTQPSTRQITAESPRTSIAYSRSPGVIKTPSAPH